MGLEINVTTEKIATQVKESGVQGLNPGQNTHTKHPSFLLNQIIEATLKFGTYDFHHVCIVPGCPVSDTPKTFQQGVLNQFILQIDSTPAVQWDMSDRVEPLTLEKPVSVSAALTIFCIEFLAACLKQIKGLSNVKEEVYGALDSFVAWELEFPLIAVKKALKTLESEKEWKRVIQVTKWMLSKGQGKTMGSYYMLLNALTEDGRLEEAEELWAKLFSENLENLPPKTGNGNKNTKKGDDELHEDVDQKGKSGRSCVVTQVFADMEELGVKPNNAIVSMIGNVFQKLDMQDKYEKLHKKYPPVRWEYRYFKGKRVRVPAKQPAHEELGTNPVDQPKEEPEEDDAHEQHDAIDQLEEVGEADTHPVDQLTEVDKEYNVESVGQGL
ncbi:hypothetical protein ACLOJK_014276 [Asimina triloba]